MTIQRVFSDETRNAIATQWASGLTAQTIADALGLSRNNVTSLVRRMKLPKRERDMIATVRGWKAKRIREAKPKEVKPQEIKPRAPTPIGPIGDFPDGDTCRFIAGEVQGFQCCGHAGYPYCEYHAGIVYQPRKAVAA